MARTDAKNFGRYNTDTVTNQIEATMEGWREGYGDVCQYYRLNSTASEFDDVFYEAIGAGRVYYSPVTLPCQHVTYGAGPNENGEMGFYQTDTLVLQVAYEAYTGAGDIMPDLDIGEYERDRVVYNNEVYRVTSITPEGKIRQRPTVVLIQCVELKGDELVDDPQFAQWSA